jgi:hypothetical protein
MGLSPHARMAEADLENHAMHASETDVTLFK